VLGPFRRRRRRRRRFLVSLCLYYQFSISQTTRFYTAFSCTPENGGAYSGVRFLRATGVVGRFHTSNAVDVSVNYGWWVGKF